MKPLYKCDFCDMTGTEENVYIHEATCTDNPNRKSCQYCENKKTSFNSSKVIYTCDFKNIPEGQQYINCDKFTLKIKKMNDFSVSGIFESFFSPRG